MSIDEKKNEENLDKILPNQNLHRIASRRKQVVPIIERSTRIFSFFRLTVWFFQLRASTASFRSDRKHRFRVHVQWDKQRFPCVRTSLPDELLRNLRRKIIFSFQLFSFVYLRHRITTHLLDEKEDRQPFEVFHFERPNATVSNSIRLPMHRSMHFYLINTRQFRLDR